MNKVIIVLVLCYKKLISPLFPGRCRFYPSCSEYMIQSINKHGVFKGVLRGVYRVLRCNPFCKGGVDEP